jgi:hypothetical protein
MENGSATTLQATRNAIGALTFLQRQMPEWLFNGLMDDFDNGLLRQGDLGSKVRRYSAF